MRIFINANAEQEKEIKKKSFNEDVELIFAVDLPPSQEYKNIDAFFILNKKAADINFDELEEKPVFINSVIETLSQFQLPANVSRINGWPGFLQREIWEVVSENTIVSIKIFATIGWKIVFTKDEPGLVAARVISMIINEAF
ncbi:MAG: hypothetical protein ABIR03_07170, partial [Ginsengibacter sp.]